MPTVLSRYATPLITGLFIVSLVSGIALFLHIGPVAFHGVHEWLSMVLIVPFVLHIWKNWRAMTTYFRRAAMPISLVLSFVAAGVFFIPTGETSGPGGPPQFRLAQAVLKATPEVVAPLFGVSTEVLVSQLESSGMPPGAQKTTLKEIAAASGKSEADLAVALLALQP